MTRDHRINVAIAIVLLLFVLDALIYGTMDEAVAWGFALGFLGEVDNLERRMTEMEGDV